MRARTMWIAGVVVAVLVTAGFLVIARHPGANVITPGTPDRANDVVDPRAGALQAPEVEDTPLVPAVLVARAATEGTTTFGPRELSQYEQYLSATAAIARENAPALNELVDTLVSALMNDDVQSLAAVWAPDERVNTGYVESIARTYPTMNSGEFQKTVNVFSVRKATAYFAYALVSWTDGGVVSSHTIAVPVRFISGKWYLSSIGLNTDGLTSVQTVQLQ